MNKIAERMRARLTNSDRSITKILSEYQAAHRPRPATHAAAPLTREDSERINRFYDRNIRHAIATSPELHDLRRRKAKEAAAREARSERTSRAKFFFMPE